MGSGQRNPCCTCLHFRICMEQRGRCAEFKSREEIRQQIESINKKYKSARRPGTDTGGLPKASAPADQQRGQSGGASRQLSETSSGDTKAEEKAIEEEGKARSETAQKDAAKDMDAG